MLRIRLKGARWAYDVDYESIFELWREESAKKGARGQIQWKQQKTQQE